jgi:D-3-phosphoglycerate dehydrogenase
MQLHPVIRAGSVAVVTGAARGIGLAARSTVISGNVSRGPLVDEAVLARLLQERRLFGAGLDVFKTEPPRPGNLLLGLPSIVRSDHAGWYSEESVAELQHKAAGEVARILSGAAPINWTNRWSEAA